MKNTEVYKMLTSIAMVADQSPEYVYDMALDIMDSVTKELTASEKAEIEQWMRDLKEQSLKDPNSKVTIDVKFKE